MNRIKEHWVLILAVALGVSVTLGALQLFATKGEVEQVVVMSKCGQVSYNIDKTQGQIWQIEDRYRNPDGSVRRMAPHDSKRMRDLLKQLDNWQKWWHRLGCVPGKGW